MSGALEEDVDNGSIHDELDRRLQEFGDVMWELGPGDREPNLLAVPPDGDPELLPVTQRIAELAPHINGWEFLPGRPARDLVEGIQMRSQRGHDISVRTGDWRYTLLDNPDGIYHVVLEQGSLGDANEEERYAAAALFIDFVLGEEQALLRIARIEPVEAMGESDARASNSVAVMRGHFESLGE